MGEFFAENKIELTEDFGPMLITSGLNPEESTEGGGIDTANPNKGGTGTATDARMGYWFCRMGTDACLQESYNVFHAALQSLQR